MIESRTRSPGEDFLALFANAHRIVTDSIIPGASMRDPQRTGGWFALWRFIPSTMEMATPVLGFAVGEISTERFYKYMHFANEKPWRLAQHSDHISSWQSRDDSDPDPMKRKWGGAIRLPHGPFLSFSGFSEHEDEMICVLTAKHMGLMGDEEIDQIVAISENVPLRSYIDSMRALGTW